MVARHLYLSVAMYIHRQIMKPSEHSPCHFRSSKITRPNRYARAHLYLSHHSRLLPSLSTRSYTDRALAAFCLVAFSLVAVRLDRCLPGFNGREATRLTGFLNRFGSRMLAPTCMLAGAVDQKGRRVSRCLSPRHRVQVAPERKLWPD